MNRYAKAQMLAKALSKLPEAVTINNVRMEVYVYRHNVGLFKGRTEHYCIKGKSMLDAVTKATTYIQELKAMSERPD